MMRDERETPFEEEILPDAVLEKAGEHRYTSTACYHGLHGRCRVSCKFCGTVCECRCHE